MEHFHGIAPARDSDGFWPVPLPAALIAHALLIAAIALITPVELPTPTFERIIKVDILSEAAFRDATSPGPATPRASRPAAIALPAAEPKSQSKEAPSPAADERVVEATQLRAGAILLEPASREVRKTLPTLSPYERMTQLCNIEATEQIRMAKKGSDPDSVSASAFADTRIEEGRLVAPGAAYRSARKWYAVRFTCAVRGDLEAVTAFSLKLGDPIPEAEWEAHNLIAEDEDDD